MRWLRSHRIKVQNGSTSNKVLIAHCEAYNYTMTLFNRISPNDLQVRVNYGKADVCGAGPFMLIKANKSQISQLIDPERLIEYLKPPLHFIWRKVLFYWVFGMIGLTQASTLAFVLIVNNESDEAEIKKMSYAFLGIIFFLVLIELMGIVLCFELFQKQLIEYIQKLNSTQLVNLGLQLYYSQGYCWGKNINVLGIRKTEVDAQLMNGETEEDGVANQLN